MSPIIKNSLIALGFALMAWLGYMYFFPSDGGVVVETVNPVAKNAQELLVALHQLQAVHIDDHLFQDPRFQSLVDFRQEITPEPIGRENPFTPYTTE